MPARLHRDRQGTISLIFGVSIFVIFGVAGIGLDSIRAQRTATRTSTALDAAALAAARAMSENDNLSTADIQALARQIFADNTPAFARQGVIASTPGVTPDRATGAVQMSTTLRVATTLGKVIGIQDITFNKSTTVSYASRKVELAMVLDVTGSMNAGGKLQAMKDAAKDVIDVLIDDNRPGITRVALAPYSAAINVGTYKDIASGGDSLDGCVMERLFNPERDTDEPPGGGNNYAVNGQLNTVANGRYLCPAAVLKPLNADRTALKNAIDAFAAQGGTAGHIGVAWGWNVLSPKWSSIFTGASAPAASSPNVTKAMLIMTDGLFNTSYTAGTSDAEQTAESAARAHALCTAMKAAPNNVQIYAVGYQPTLAAETLLRDCASSSSHYYDALDNAQLKAAFKDIATKLQEIRVSQ